MKDQRIFVIDDDRDVCALLDEFLQGLGYRVSSFSGIADFLESAKREKPDLIISDIQMPGGGAPLLMSAIDGMPGFDDVPVVFCSAMGTYHMKQWFPENGLRRYHQKPLDLSLLKTQIRELLSAAGEELGENKIIDGRHPAPEAKASESALDGPPAMEENDSSRGESAPAVPISEDTKRLPDAAPSSFDVPSSRLNLIKAFHSVPIRKDNDGMNAQTLHLTNTLLSVAVEEKASDVYLDPERGGVLVRFRVDGVIRDILRYPKNMFAIATRLRILANLSPLPPAAGCPEEGAFDVDGGKNSVRVRLSYFPSVYGGRIVLRILDPENEVLKLGNLGLSPAALEELKAAIRHAGGIFLSSGPTGSGKTTTLCGILKALAGEGANIMTLEDPVEYLIPRVIHTEINRSAGFTFAEGLRAVMRQNPSVIMVGEIRDQETAQLAFRAATTGHMVASSIHAVGATGIVTRLVGMNIEPYLLNHTRVVALAQRLARKLCPDCAEPAEADEEAFQRTLRGAEPALCDMARAAFLASGGTFLKAKGCERCGGEGYHGRVGVFELLAVDHAVKKAVMEEGDPGKVLKAALDAGMRPLLLEAIDKVRAGITSMEEVCRLMTQW